MFKIIEPGSWPRLESQGIASILPCRKNGSITMSDRHRFFRKTAASERFLHELDRVKLGDGDIPVHVNAIGAAEYYGPNRKGDAFSEQVCRDRHQTFVTEGRNYVHHRNRDPDISYGKIASSCYNDAMHRIELLVLTSGSDAAAQRNGGLVVPDEFLSKLEKNAEVPVSMGCTINHDVCAICGNKARTRAEYCDDNNCLNPKTGEYHPGCRHGLMKVAADGTQQFVYNIEPTFFDLSYVGVPADRTGYGFRADYLPHTFGKSASVDDEPIRLLGLPPAAGGSRRYRSEMTDMLGKLAAYEKSGPVSDIDRAFFDGTADQDETLGRKLAGMLPPTRYAAIGLLAREGVLLTPENFRTAFAAGKSAGLATGGLYADALARYRDTDTLATILASLDDPAYVKLAALRCPASWIRHHRPDASPSGTSAVIGTIRSARNSFQNSEKSASVDREFSDAYALYSAAALCRFPLEMQALGVKIAAIFTMGHGSF